MHLIEPYKSETFRAKLALIVGTATPRLQEQEKPRERKSGVAKGGRGNKSDVVIKIEEMLESDFLNNPKTMREIQAKLQEQGYSIDLTELSPRLLWLIRNNQLKRVKNERKRFVYSKHHNNSGLKAETSDTNLSSKDV